jgi:hypothetical protein
MARQDHLFHRPPPGPKQGSGPRSDGRSGHQEATIGVGGKGAQKNPEIAPEGMVTGRILPAKFLEPGPIRGAASHPGVERVYPDPPAVSSPVRPACSLRLRLLPRPESLPHTPQDW